jgi:hypothetical protein
MAPGSFAVGAGKSPEIEMGRETSVSGALPRTRRFRTDFRVASASR